MRRRSNKIEALLNANNDWVYDDHDIQQVLLVHFQNLFTSSNHSNLSLQTLSGYPPIKDEDLHSLGLPVTLMEVQNALFSMGTNYKAPGPDGFHPLFFKAKWEIVGPSIFQFVQHVFEEPSKIGDINHTLLTLIPKVIEPLDRRIFVLLRFVTLFTKLLPKLFLTVLVNYYPTLFLKINLVLLQDRILLIMLLFYRKLCIL